MAKKRKKVSKTAHERELLRQRMKTLEKKGFVFPEAFVESLEYRTAKTLHSYRNITLAREAYYVPKQQIASMSVGLEQYEAVEIMSGASAYTMLRKQSAYKGAQTRKHKAKNVDYGSIPNETDLGFSKLMEFIETFEPQWGYGRRGRNWNKMESARNQAHTTIKTIYNRVEEEIGQHGVLNRIKQSGIDLNTAIFGILSESNTETIVSYGNQIANAINGGTLSQEDNAIITSAIDSEFINTGTSYYEGKYRSISTGRKYEKTKAK